MCFSVRKNHIVNDMHIEVKKAMEKEQMISGGGGRGGRGGMAGGRGYCCIIVSFEYTSYVLLRFYYLHTVLSSCVCVLNYVVIFTVYLSHYVH